MGVNLSARQLLQADLVEMVARALFLSRLDPSCPNLVVTGEGIETAEQLGQLQALGCDRGQGYLFARPLDADEIGALLARGPRVPRSGLGWARHSVA